MHINDWSPEFLSKFSPEEYVENLKRAKIDNAMIYLQSHVGLCYYPTKTGKVHAAFVGKEDTMKRLISLCHEAGITVTGYYSLVYNTYEHDRHPEWRMLKANGRSTRDNTGNDGIISEFSDKNATSRYGLCCPNNAEYRKFVELQIREIAEYFPDLEGMFYDMLFWPHFCYCKDCRARWASEVGGELPEKEDWSDKAWLLQNAKRREWMGEFASWVTSLTKEILPHVSVEHNVSRSASPVKDDGNAEEVVAACDYAGGDRYVTPYNQSFVCKFYQSITKNQPFEYMFSRCAPTLATHTQIKSKDTMRSAVFITSAHHGATFIIDAVDPVGTMDKRVYERIGEVFSESLPYEKYFIGKPVYDVGIYYSLKSKFTAAGEAYSNYNATENSVTTFIRENVLSGITGSFHGFDEYSVLVLPLSTSEDAFDNGRVIDYVKRGGKLYFSGAANPELIREFFGAEITSRTKERVVYISPEDSVSDAFEYFDKVRPIAFSSSAPIASGIDKEKVIAKITLPYTNQDTSKFASIHSNPPGIPTDIPAMAMTDYGEGKVIWSALPIETQTLYDYRNIFRNIIADVLGARKSIVSDAPYDVELTVFKTENSYLVSSVLLTNEYKARTLADFGVKLALDKAPSEVVLLPSEEKVPFEYKDGFAEFTFKSPRMFEMYEVRI